MAWTMWIVEVEGNRVGLPMDYNEALELEAKYRSQGYRARVIMVRDGKDV